MVKSKDRTTHVELVVECFWTRVRFPPPPPIHHPDSSQDVPRTPPANASRGFAFPGSPVIVLTNPEGAGGISGSTDRLPLPRYPQAARTCPDRVDYAATRRGNSRTPTLREAGQARRWRRYLPRCAPTARAIGGLIQVCQQGKAAGALASTQRSV